MNISKDHRESLTRAAIGQKLKKDATQTGWGLLIAIPLITLIALGIYFEMTAFFGKHPIIYVLVGGMAAVCLAGVVRVVYDIVRTVRAVDLGQYTVTEDTFCHLEIRELPVRQQTKHHKFDYIFSFASGKTYAADSLEDTDTRLEYAMQFSKEGEIFYLVAADSTPEKILLIYPGSLFRYENR